MAVTKLFGNRIMSHMHLADFELHRFDYTDKSPFPERERATSRVLDYNRIDEFRHVRGHGWQRKSSIHFRFQVPNTFAFRLDGCFS
jgi:hypothetical protein